MRQHGAVDNPVYGKKVAHAVASGSVRREL